MANTRQAPQPQPQRKASWNEEPEPDAEESVPSDGKDELGEQMMEELGRERAARRQS
jgi:hypothetical protein